MEGAEGREGREGREGGEQVERRGKEGGEEGGERRTLLEKRRVKTIKGMHFAEVGDMRGGEGWRKVCIGGGAMWEREVYRR